MIKNLHPYWYETYHSLEQQGLSQRKIAKEMGVHRTTLQHWLKEQKKEPLQDVCKGVSNLSTDAVTEMLAVVKKWAKSKEHENQRILLISDMHIPYHHKDSLAFLQYLKVKYKPTRVICLGDLEDKHALSYHDSDPDLPSAGDELSKALPVIAKLHDMFPVMSILDSNHGSLVYRKAKTHGIPKSYIKPYNQLLGVGDGWTWHNDLVINLPDGNSCYLHHGKSARGLILTQQMGMSSVQGHYHNSFSVEYHGTPIALNWAMQVGCLIDHKSYAFSYANVNIKRQIIGTGLIIDSQPLLVPLLMDGNGNWIKPNDYDIVMCGET
jgi:transposase